ncbi:2-oxoglutarate and iron-dependent oxygenase domain-containing protein [Asanoa sp. WMMD1127]|uniref:isopenicillin N synthase family dioxygenase n=1 Tax=Asanoa sp. WMMD1127 TaxID=3016107 RepID=UPI0024167627|nr:2-oxoglutarate and iron-dependent oxygenase domain-containing protein [Asanoa sp. WMMD1127]MDG4821257.1 2-oxoglutarate and iron-dependent oxygenase domain-containing protein [Asanoa sp. WMMD1127]
MASTRLPVIDVGPLRSGTDPERVAREIESACRDTGFFYVTGHGVPAALLARMDAAARTFFALSEAEKMAIAMPHAGPAWRGYFPLGGELTAGRPDRKEGIYFGEELADGDPRAGLPLHGRNLFPAAVPELRAAVLDYVTALTGLAQDVMRGVARSLDLPADYFAAGYTRVPTVLFRIFHYPPQPPDTDEWGVGEHTDYGLLTLLAQDQNGGLSVRTPGGWVDAPPLPGTFVCNIGDMLERLTGGWYRSTVHRVRNVSGNERLSYPFFFDPDFSAEVPPLPGRARTTATGEPRWDGADPVAFTGTYGDYLTAKVAKVFPELFEATR